MKEIDPNEFDIYELNRQLDITKSHVFMGTSAAFLGSIMSSMDFIWTTSIPTAGTNGVNFVWNPLWFLSLVPEVRKTVFVHELWHPGRLHQERCGTRNPRWWNYACDIRINNDLEDQGYSFRGVEDCWKNQHYRGWVEEDIYEDITQHLSMPDKASWGDPGGEGDLLPDDSDTRQKAVNNIVRAAQTAKMAGETLPGDIEEMIKTFLAPVVPWEAELQQWMSDLLDEDYSFRKPNRRYQDVYLPSLFIDDGKLEHLIFYEDVSGSISTADSVRFNSELKYVWETFQPQKLTIVQFDTRITKIDILEEGDDFNEIRIVGGGGTDLRPVYNHIVQTKPTGVIIFSDMLVHPMKKLPFDVPILWVAINNRGAIINEGKIIHIKG